MTGCAGAAVRDVPAQRQSLFECRPHLDSGPDGGVEDAFEAGRGEDLLRLLAEIHSVPAPEGSC
jgi:hypothetical protein